MGVELLPLAVMVLVRTAAWDGAVTVMTAISRGYASFIRNAKQGAIIRRREFMLAKRARSIQAIDHDIVASSRISVWFG